MKGMQNHNTAIFQNPGIHISLAKILCIKTSLLFAGYWSSFMTNVHFCLYMKPASLIAHSGIMLGQIHSCIIRKSTSTTMGMAKCWIKRSQRGQNKSNVDVMTWKCILNYCLFLRGIQQMLGNDSHRGSVIWNFDITAMTQGHWGPSQ